MLANRKNTLVMKTYVGRRVRPRPRKQSVRPFVYTSPTSRRAHLGIPQPRRIICVTRLARRSKLSFIVDATTFIRNETNAYRSTLLSRRPSTDRPYCFRRHARIGQRPVVPRPGESPRVPTSVAQQFTRTDFSRRVPAVSYSPGRYKRHGVSPIISTSVPYMVQHIS